MSYVRFISGNLNWTAAAQLLATILKWIDRFNGWMKKNSGLVYVWTVTRVCRENPAGFTTDRSRFVWQSIWEWLKDQEQSKIRLCERDNVGNHCLKTHSCSNAELLTVVLFTLSGFFHSSHFFLQIKWFTIWWTVECLRSVCVAHVTFMAMRNIPMSEQ